LLLRQRRGGDAEQGPETGKYAHRCLLMIIDSSSEYCR